ncbi:MAG: DNA translocase FtsK 4TM domain-containing protein [Myxococcales bacterium]|nr:MAG: DNA translocase FtsK 4TM domain-containing protein [Myxococcales bacterium]
MGVAAWLIPLELFLFTLRLFGRVGVQLGAARAASVLVIVLISCAMMHLAFGETLFFGGHTGGGLLGEITGEVLRSLLGTIGTYIVCTTILIVTILLRTPFSIASTMRWSNAQLSKVKARVAAAWEEAKRLEEARRLEQAEFEAEEAPVIKVSKKPNPPVHDEAIPEELETEEEPSRSESTPPTRSAAKAKTDAPGGPIIVPPKLSPRTNGKSSSISPTQKAPRSKTGKPFALPSTTLLDEIPSTSIRVDEKTLKNYAERLVQKLKAYGVEGRVDEIHPGPVVTMYEFEPASGTKVSKIASLADDLAMALAAQKVRIVAPIVGKARVGFELPNKKRQTVSIRDILEDSRWQDMEAALPIALGKDIAGQPVYADLSRMPHLLVAGATGAGKSVGLNVMLSSLLFKKTPEELRLLMIDPKVVELAAYDGIPHMLLPVVTDMKKAALALRWAVDEMERRYQLFADAGARNVQSYNERVEKVERGELSLEKLAPKKMKQLQLELDEGKNPEPFKPEKLPYVVIVVDEFADLIMVSAKDVEAAITRLAQKARAAGMHVILATQRPSVDVITGVIKANFPTRIGYKVSQREDSKTILGRSGAEHLLGMGDMLMLPPGSGELKRVHSAFISEDELRNMCDFLRDQGNPVYDERILKPREEDADGGGGGPARKGDDEKYDRAVAIVAEAGYCSISHIQRQLGVGYNKAALIVERMEKDGVVGPPSGKAGGRREVLVQSY